MTFIKQTLKNTASLILAVWIIGSAYAAISTVSSGDPLTADSWNQIVNKISNTDTNSDDLVTKSYVDATVSANSWNTSGSIDWNDCNFKSVRYQHQDNTTLTCDSWYALVTHSCIWSSDPNGTCQLNWVNSLKVIWWSSNSSSTTMWSIKCCKVHP